MNQIMNEDENGTDAQAEQPQQISYRYTYKVLTPKQRKEAEGILREYEGGSRVEETNYQRLIRLEKRVRQGAEIFALTWGVLSTLIFGGGMSLALLNSVNIPLLMLGCGVGLLGCVLIALAYPFYRVVLKKRKEKYGEEIRMLCKMVLKEEGGEE